MKIVIPGGSGQVGRVLARAFYENGDEVVVLSRKPTTEPWKVVCWDGETLGEWIDELGDANVLINLAGRSVNCRYHQKNRREIMGSRIRSVQLIGDALRRLAKYPKVWMQASTATIYADRYDAPHDEETGFLGGDEPHVPPAWKFSIDVATAWEKVFDELSLRGTRKIKLRSAVILSPDRGGIFDYLLHLVRFGLGGTSGTGKQYVSWIHDADLIQIIFWLLKKDDLEGVLNVSSPYPLPQSEFMRILRKAWGIPFGLPASRWMLEWGTWMMRTESELVLKSRRVIPGKLLRSGYEFIFPNWELAAKDLCKRWTDQGTHSRFRFLEKAILDSDKYNRQIN